jgi:hypothetical protein
MNANELHSEGWHSVDAGSLPPRNAEVEFARDERVYRQTPWIGKWSDFDPAFNVAGLWWRVI